MNIYGYITIGTMLLMTFLILIQTAGDVNTTRRGTDKTIYQITIILGIIFAISLILGETQK